MLDRIDARIDAGECVALMGAVRFGQIDSDEHWLSISSTSGDLILVLAVGSSATGMTMS